LRSRQTPTGLGFMAFRGLTRHTDISYPDWGRVASGCARIVPRHATPLEARNSRQR